MFHNVFTLVPLDVQLAIVFFILYIRYLELADKTYMLFLTGFVVSSGRRRE